MRSLISLTDLDVDGLATLVDRGVAFGKNLMTDGTLAGRAIGIYFHKSSTRTRTSFWRAATRLGADVIAFGPDDLQLATGESFIDTAKVLSSYLDALVVRTNDDIRQLRHLAAVSSLGVVNALTEHEHPTQAVTDLVTLKEHFGDLHGRHVLYVGEGNSTAASLVHATALTPGLRLTLLTPANYGLGEQTFELAARLGGEPGRITQRHQVGDVSGRFDAIYTSRWQTMGVPKADPNWMAEFRAFQVTRGFFDQLRESHTVFMHDLPAIRGQEVTDSVLDGPESVTWRQAFHKMTGAMAVLEWCVST